MFTTEKVVCVGMVLLVWMTIEVAIWSCGVSEMRRKWRERNGETETRGIGEPEK